MPLSGSKPCATRWRGVMIYSMPKSNGSFVGSPSLPAVVHWKRWRVSLPHSVSCQQTCWTGWPHSWTRAYCARWSKRERSRAC